MKNFCQSLNLFASVPPTTDEDQLRNQKLSTRLFIVLLILSLTILLLYNSVATVNKTVTIKNPTIDEYLQLYARYPQTLTCPCTHISIKYEMIVTVEFSLHQVCTSDFVTNDWIDYLILVASGIKVHYDDFRRTAMYLFQGLRALCDIMNKTISVNLNRFYSGEYVSAFVTPSEQFRSLVEASIDRFRITTIDSFSLALFLIRYTTQSNAILSAIQTHHYLYVPYANKSIVSSPHIYGNCSCASTAVCSRPSAIKDYPDSRVKFTVPGFYVGCYVIESLLQSTFECFYNQSCIDRIKSFCGPPDIKSTALNSSLPSRYFMNSTIHDLVNNLMIEGWYFSENYRHHYAECQPTECSYTYTAKNDVLYIVTALIGLLGGLMKILNIFVPRFVAFFIRYILKRENRVHLT